MRVSKSAVDAWVWTLIYGGLLASSLGLFARRSLPALGWTFVVGGGFVAAAGVLLIWVRSRMAGA